MVLQCAQTRDKMGSGMPGFCTKKLWLSTLIIWNSKANRHYKNNLFIIKRFKEIYHHDFNRWSTSSFLSFCDCHKIAIDAASIRFDRDSLQYKNCDNDHELKFQETILFYVNVKFLWYCFNHSLRLILRLIGIGGWWYR